MKRKIVLTTRSLLNHWGEKNWRKQKLLHFTDDVFYHLSCKGWENAFFPLQWYLNWCSGVCYGEILIFLSWDRGCFEYWRGYINQNCLKDWILASSEGTLNVSCVASFLNIPQIFRHPMEHKENKSVKCC